MLAKWDSGSDEPHLLSSGIEWAARGVCMVPRDLAIDANPVTNPVPYLQILDASAYRDFAQYVDGIEDATVVFHAHMRTWEGGGDSKVIAGCVKDFGSLKIWCMNGLRGHDAGYAMILRCAIVWAHCQEEMPNSQ